MRLPLYHCAQAPFLDATMAKVFEPAQVTRWPDDIDQPVLVHDGARFAVLMAPGEKPFALPPYRQARTRGPSLLARACGDAGTVLDAMCGWGTDALTLRAAGWEVQACEQHPLVWALLRQRLPEVVLEDAWAYIDRGRWPVIYLDPMFPPRGRKGLAKGPLQALQRLAQPDERSVEAWLAHARGAATDRVVLKQRLKAPAISRPDWQLKGRSVRFDVYRPAAPPAEKHGG